MDSGSFCLHTLPCGLRSGSNGDSAVNRNDVIIATRPDDDDALSNPSHVTALLKMTGYKHK
jgi:hypothetical protein